MRAPSSTLTLRVFMLGALGALGCGTKAVSGDNPQGGGSASSDGYRSACTNPRPYLPGHDTGIFLCQEGYLHRAEARACPSDLPRDRTVEWPDAPENGADAPGGAGGVGGAGGADGSEPPFTTGTDECSRDEDCGNPLTRCELIQTNAYSGGVCDYFGAPEEEPPHYERRCVSGCRVDADCGSDSICICGTPIGQCANVSDIAGCHSDADCEGDAQCLQTAHTSYDDNNSFACQLPGDTCDSDSNCGGFPNYCLISDTGRACQEMTWSCGRPFLIESEARLAAPRCTDEWLAPSRGTFAGAMSVAPDLARVLAAHWTEIGLMEHASIAAFARFTLQLLSMGAPADLVEASNRAQTDETRHARMAFELASQYANEPVGPGSLSLAGTVLDAEWENILRTTIEEGCLGETCAALEASHAAELCADPAVSDVLRAIAKDEAEHAALAWRAVRWILQARPALRTLAERTFAEVDTRHAGAGATLSLSARTTAESHGALDDVTRAACRANAVREIVLPCAHPLLASNADESPRAARTASTALSL